MSCDIVGEFAEKRIQPVRVVDAHQLLDVVLARHIELRQEKAGRERRIDLAARRALEPDQQIDRGPVKPYTLVPIVVQQVVERPIAHIELDDRRIRMPHHSRHAPVRRHRLVGGHEPPQLRADLRRIVREHVRLPVRCRDSQIRTYRGVAGQALGRPLRAKPLLHERFRLGRKWRANLHDLRQCSISARYCGFGPFSAAVAARTVMLLIATGLFGLSLASRGPPTILSATSIPLVTCPKTVYWLSRNGESLTTIKNCDDALSGLAERAIDTMPRLCEILLNSALTFDPEPPVPHVDVLSVFVFGSPP